MGAGRGVRGRIMKATYRVVAMLIAACVVLQAMFIALGWFIAIKDMDDGLVIDKNYDGNIGHTLHGQFGTLIIPLLALVLLIISFFAHVNGGVKWAAIVFGLVVLQIALAFLSFGVAPAIGALHGLNAFAVGGAAAYAGRRAALQLKMMPEATTVTAP
jgi:hypothetical protein